VRQQLDTVPRQQRAIVTSHDAFQYLGHRYGVDVLAIVGISTEQAPRPQDIQRIEQQVTSRGVKALFIETSVAQTLNTLVEKLANTTGAKIGGTLYSDSLGPPEEASGTYLGMMRHNVTTIVEALK
jgi:ABC-type Zn uptake system ZnuABC Zn-binding protein ZnuA